MLYILERSLNRLCSTRLASRISSRLHFKRTFSQNGEDIVVSTIADWLGVKIDVFLDVGAHDPVEGSNTYLFSLMGGRGIAVEPNKRFLPRWRKLRPRDKLVRAACGSSGSSDYYNIDVDALSTLSSQHADACVLQGHKLLSVEKIDVLTLDCLIANNPMLEDCDLLSIDVEGLEEDVISTSAFDRFRPKFIVVETLEYRRESLGAKRAGIHPILQSLGYTFVADTMLNSIFVDSSLYR